MAPPVREVLACEWMLGIGRLGCDPGAAPTAPSGAAWQGEHDASVGCVFLNLALETQTQKKGWGGLCSC